MSDDFTVSKTLSVIQVHLPYVSAVYKLAVSDATRAIISRSEQVEDWYLPMPMFYVDGGAILAEGRFNTGCVLEIVISPSEKFTLDVREKLTVDDLSWRFSGMDENTYIDTEEAFPYLRLKVMRQNPDTGETTQVPVIGLGNTRIVKEVLPDEIKQELKQVVV